MPQTAHKDTGEEPVFFTLACVRHESVFCTFRHRIDPNPAVIVMED